MDSGKLRIKNPVKADRTQLLMGFTGWMDGGSVSTGTLRYMIEEMQAQELAEIDPAGFYIYNFPGSMEISALFRPHTKINDGIIQEYLPPENEFYYDDSSRLVLFSGKEPNLSWREYADCIFSLCERMNVKRICFIGSVAGLTPHTREPRIFCSVSDQKIKFKMADHAVRFSKYEGPASFTTYMMVRSEQKGLEMITLVAETPAYVQGYNPRCIETATKCAAAILGLHVPLEKLRNAADEFEKKLSEQVSRQDELDEKVHELEQAYDDDVFDTEMTDLKNWLQAKGIRLD